MYILFQIWFRLRVSQISLNFVNCPEHKALWYLKLCQVLFLNAYSNVALSLWLIQTLPFWTLLWMPLVHLNIIYVLNGFMHFVSKSFLSPFKTNWKTSCYKLQDVQLVQTRQWLIDAVLTGLFWEICCTLIESEEKKSMETY